MANISRRDQGQRGELSTYRRGPFGTLQDAFDTMFDRLMSQWGGPYGSEMSGLNFLDFNVDQTDDEVIVRADMPGFEAQDIEINLDQNVLTIQAQQQQQDPRAREFRSFFRTVALPMGVDPDKVKADYRNGVLEIHIPRREEAKPRRIQVQGQQGHQAITAGTGQQAGTTGHSTGVPSGSQAPSPAGGTRGTSSAQGTSPTQGTSATQGQKKS